MFIQFYHILTLDALIHKRSNKEEGLIDMTNIPEWFQLFDIKVMFFFDPIPKKIKNTLNNKSW